MMDANPSKLQAIMLNAKMETRFNMGGDIITSEDTVILLGIALDKQLNFTQQTRVLCCKATTQLSVLQRMANQLDLDSHVYLEMFYFVSFQLLPSDMVFL